MTNGGHTVGPLGTVLNNTIQLYKTYEEYYFTFLILMYFPSSLQELVPLPHKNRPVTPEHLLRYLSAKSQLINTVTYIHYVKPKNPTLSENCKTKAKT